MDKKKILVLTSSARKRGNTDLLSDEFMRGAEAAGHTTEKLHVSFMKINGCLGCLACQKNGGKCVQKDDMTEVYEKMKEADVIVFASPVYFYNFNAQMKAVIDRTIALNHTLENKVFYLVTTGVAPDEKYMSLIKENFKLYSTCFKGTTIGGMIVATGTNKKKDVLDTPFMKQAYDAGYNL